MRLLLAISDKIGTFRFWRILTNFWTGVFYIAIVYDFFGENALAKSDILIAIAAIYCASLAIYSTEKEFRRWHDMHNSMHPGEVYAVIWTAFVLFLICAQLFLDLDYKIPAEISASYIAVISILALTRESKNLHKRKAKRSN